MKEWELRISAEAEQSIEDQLKWYESNDAGGGADLADRWLDLLEKALQTLKRHPERNGFAPENGRWMPNILIRQTRFKPWKTPSAWRILYAVDKISAHVTVLQVRHERRPLLPERD